MRISRMLGAIAVMVAVVAVCLGAASAALRVYGTVSEVTWSQYAEQEEVDTLIVGTSFIQHAIDPTVLAQSFPCAAFDMGSPDQTLQESLIGIKTAYEDHGIKRVILNVNSLSSDMDDEVNMNDEFLRQHSRYATPAQSLAAWWDLAVVKGGLATDSSLNVIFPWEKNHVNLTPTAIFENMRMRLSGTDLAEAAQVSDPERVFHASGYSNTYAQTDYNSEDVRSYYTEPDGEWEPAANKSESLREICRYCAERDIDLVVIGVPMPPYVVLDYGDAGEDYFLQQAAIQKILDEHGLTYYDFTMARPELFETKHEFFFGLAHLNEYGGAAFTESFGRFMGELSAGHDVSSLFYDEDGYLASIDYVDALMVDAEPVEGGVSIAGDALAGPDVAVEYRMSIQDESGAWNVVRDYAQDRECVIDPGRRGVVPVKVEAREVGSQADYEYYRETEVLY